MVVRVRVRVRFRVLLVISSHIMSFRSTSYRIIPAYGQAAHHIISYHIT